MITRHCIVEAVVPTGTLQREVTPESTLVLLAFILGLLTGVNCSHGAGHPDLPEFRGSNIDVIRIAKSVRATPDRTPFRSCHTFEPPSQHGRQ